MASNRGGKRAGAGRPAGSRSSKHRALLHERAPEVMERLLTAALDEQDSSALSLLVARVMPPLKAESEAVGFDADGDGTPADYARSILKATAAGKLSPTAASELLGAVGQAARVIEIDELERRISALEGKS